MIIKSHICGLATCYEEFKRGSGEPDPLFEKEKKGSGRLHGSRDSQNKKKVVDACLMLRARFKKPLVFVATTPGFLETAKENSYIGKLTHNLRNGYGVSHYVWVREFTGHGYPHYHFVVDVDWIDAIKISLFWSGLFGSDAKNSIRLGFKPIKGKPRTYHMNNDKLAWYYGKYIGKALGTSEAVGRGFRSFKISNELGRMSLPVLYEAHLYTAHDGRHGRNFIIKNEFADRFETGWPEPVTTVDPYKWKWNYTGYGSCYTGVPKSWKAKTGKSTGGTTGKNDFSTGATTRIAPLS